MAGSSVPGFIGVGSCGEVLPEEGIDRLLDAKVVTKCRDVRVCRDRRGDVFEDAPQTQKPNAELDGCAANPLVRVIGELHAKLKHLLVAGVRTEPR